mgnify:CR=1 FL=1
MTGRNRTRISDGRAGERGQSAIAFIILILVIFMLFALAFDVGLAAFDHRWAQNQAEAAALAGALQLPSDQDGPARDAAIQTLQRNGALDGRTYNQVDIWVGYSDANGFHPDARNALGKYDSVRVRLRRTAPAFFARLFEFGSISVESIFVSAAATAKAGSAGAADRVMPWGVVPPAPCNDPGQTNCWTEGFRLNNDKLYSLMCDSPGCDGWTAAPGNLGALRVCDYQGGGNPGSGANEYRDCISLDAPSAGVFEVGGMVNVWPRPGNMGNRTNDGLNAYVSKYGEPITGPGAYPCDVLATPDPVTGADPDGREAALNKLGYNPTTGGFDLNSAPQCSHRAVLIPVVNGFPQGTSGSATILALATFYIAGWDRRGGGWGDSEGNLNTPCGNGPIEQPKGKDAQPTPVWRCGLVWGFFIPEYPLGDPRDALQKIADSPNPLAPVMVALID